jgi:phosphoglycerate dehydrogenase-like enzyme
VFTKEPPAADSKLVLHENVTVTPHLGASTVEAQVCRIGSEILFMIASSFYYPSSQNANKHLGFLRKEWPLKLLKLSLEL